MDCQDVQHRRAVLQIEDVPERSHLAAPTVPRPIIIQQSQHEENELLRIKDAPAGHPRRTSQSLLGTGQTERRAIAHQSSQSARGDQYRRQQLTSWQDRQPAALLHSASHSMDQVDGDAEEPDLMTDGYRCGHSATENHQCPLYQPTGAAEATDGNAIVERCSHRSEVEHQHRRQADDQSRQVIRRNTSSRLNIASFAQGGKRLLSALVCCSCRPTAAAQGNIQRAANP